MITSQTWHERAEEIRTLVDCMVGEVAKQQMREIAVSYDKLAKRAEAREAREIKK